MNGLFLPTFSKLALHDDIVYFVAEENEHDENGNTTGYSTSYFCSYDLCTCELKKHHKIYAGYSGGTWLYGLFQNKLYVNYGVSPTKVDYRSIDVIESMETVLMCFSLCDGSFEKASLPMPTFVGNGYYVFTRGNDTIILDEDGNEMLIQDFCSDDAIIINNKLFSSWDMICVDLETKQKYQLNCEGKEIVDFSDGNYILRLPTISGYEYIPVSLEELIVQD